MIEYQTVVGKRVVLVLVDGDEPETSTLIPGVASVDEEAYMFQIKPDQDVVYEGWEEADAVGVGCESFENDIIYKLPPVHELRKKFNVDYMIVLK